MRKTSSDIKEKAKTTRDIINFLNPKNNHKKIIKFKSVLEDKKSLSNKVSLNNFNFNIGIESKDFMEIKSNYNYIIDKINSLIKKLNKNNYEHISSLLIKIKNYINKIIPNKLTNNEISNLTQINIEKSEDHHNNYNKCKYNLDGSITSSNEKENEFNSFNKISSYYNETSPRLLTTNINSKRLKLLEQKNNNLEDKLKTEKLKYLFYIEEQDKKIKKLKLELNQKSFDNMSQKESKQYRCFPYNKKFDILDNYTQRTKTQNKKINRKKYYFFKRYDSLNKSDKEDKEDDSIQYVKQNKEYEKKVLNNNELEGKKILNKKGNYFISHPKLKYIKGDLNIKTWKTNELIYSLPKELLKHRFISKSQKNNLVIFPSSINQIIVNLEKLRIHNNFKRIENEFKKASKKNK